MSSYDAFLFEGEQVTARELRRRGVVYSVGAIQSALEAGCKTMSELVAHIERTRSANMRRSYMAGKRAVLRAESRAWW